MDTLPHLPVFDALIGLSVGGYRIESVLGEGGMGLVYRARHEFIDRRFAIKVLRPEAAANESLARSFLREAQTLSALKHPHILDIVGFGILPDGRQYMVTEFLEGVTLQQELARGALSLDRALFLADQTLSALSAAHAVDVIHRDLKPANVFLARGSGGIEVVKLLDFGLSRLQPAILLAEDEPDEARPSGSLMAGTPEYVAPEQALGAAPDQASDLYAFGVMFFEMLTRRLPFDPDATVTDRLNALLRAHASAPAPSPQDVGVQVPVQLSVLLQELLKKSPLDRPTSAVAVRQRIRAVRESLRATPLPLQLPPPEQRPAPVRSGNRFSAGGALLALCLLPLAILRPTYGAAPPVVPEVRALPAPVQPIAAAPLAEPELIALPPAPSRARKATPTEHIPECLPDERWRATARLHLQELQQQAARNPAHWAQFERLEPKLSGAVSSAITRRQCVLAEEQIRGLALSWR